MLEVGQILIRWGLLFFIPELILALEKKEDGKDDTNCWRLLSGKDRVCRGAF